MTNSARSSRSRRALLGVALALLARSTAAAWLADVDRTLSWQSPDRRWQAVLDGAIDLEAYVGEKPFMGLVFDNDTFFFQPRLTLSPAVRLGRQWSVRAQFRADRGFDPGEDEDGDVRADEYVLGFDPLESGAVQLQAGKFATLFGNWVPRHLAWDNPLITAPMAYEDQVPASDITLVPGPAGLVARQNRADNQPEWVPIIWGPSYTAGASVAGHLEQFNYGVEVKNASLSSRPGVWSPFDVGWDDPTVTARIGWDPGPAWGFGASFSRGAWLRQGAHYAGGALPIPPLEPGDWPQTVWGLDARFERHRWQVWAEVIGARFEVPNVGDADTLSYYVEVKRKLGSGFFAAARWNQQFFGGVNTAAGDRDWGSDAWRADLGLGYRFTSQAQVKIQGSVRDAEGNDPQGHVLGALQLSVRF